MSHHNYSIFGTVTDPAGQGIAAISITLDTTGPEFDRLDPVTFQAQTDADGNYTLWFSGSMMDTMFRDRNGVLDTARSIGVLFNLRAMDGSELGSYAHSLSYDDVCFGVEQNFVLDVDQLDCCCPPKPECVDRYSVHGRISDGSAAPMGDHLVVVYRKSFRDGSNLGEARTDDWGDFKIAYFEDEACDPAGPGFPIYIEVIDDSNPSVPFVLGRSALTTQPRANQRIDLRLSVDEQPPSYYVELAAALAPHTQGVDLESLTAADLRPEDARFLAGRADLDIADVRRFMAASIAYQAWQSNTPPPPHDPALITRQVLFAWLKGQDDMDLRTLAQQGEDTLARLLADEIANNRIDPITIPMGSDAETVYREIADVLVSTLYWDGIDDTGTPLGHLLSLGCFSGDAKQQHESKRAFLTAYRQRQTTVTEFFAAYSDPLVDLPCLEAHITVASILGGDFELVKDLVATMPRPYAPEIRKLALNSEADWQLLLSGRTLPTRIPGTTPATREANYAKALRRATEHIFPEVAIVAELSSGLNCGSASPCAPADLVAGVCPCTLRDIVTAEPTFSFRSSIVDRELIAYVPSMPGDPSPLEALKLLQRLYSVIPDFDAASKLRALLAAGYRSASEIVDVGQSRFVEEMSTAMGGTHAATVAYARAESVTSATTQLLTVAQGRLTPGLAGMTPRTIREPGGGTPAPTAGPSLEQIFGNLDYCQCPHCRSVLSPSAYLTDLLDYIGEDGREILGCGCPTYPIGSGRRPDICEIDLNCENSLTPLPHIDLVNELLEERVLAANNVVSDLPIARQTTWTPDQLAAHPEYLSDKAYIALRSVEKQNTGAFPTPYLSGIKSWILPYDLHLEEARQYLGQFSVPLLDLVRYLTPDDPLVKTPRLVREELQLNAGNYRLIIDPTVPDGSLRRDHPATMAWLGDSSVPGAGNSLVPFRSPRSFVKQTELSLLEAQDLLATHWAGRLAEKQSRVFLDFADDAACDLSQATFGTTGDTAGNRDERWLERFGRCHQVVRLWRHLQRLEGGRYALSFDEIDEAIDKFSQSAGQGVLGDDFLTKLVAFNADRVRFGELSVEELLCWRGDIGARPDKLSYTSGAGEPIETQYDRIFASVVAEAPADVRADLTIELSLDKATFELAAVTAGTALYEPGATNRPLPYVAAAFGVTREDLIALIDVTGLDPSPVNGFPLLSLRNLSLLYMRVSIARALGISPIELTEWEDVTGIPLSRTHGPNQFSTTDSPKLIAAIDAAKATGLTPAELRYILDGSQTPGETLALGEAESYRLVFAGLTETAVARDELPQTLGQVAGDGSDADKLLALLETIPAVAGGPAIDIEKMRVLIRGEENRGPVGFTTEADWQGYVDNILDLHYRPMFRRAHIDAPTGSLYSTILNLDLANGPTELKDRPGHRARLIAVPILHASFMTQLGERLGTLFADALGLSLESATALVGAFAPAPVSHRFLFDHTLIPTELDLGEVETLAGIADDDELLAALSITPPPRQAHYHNMFQLFGRVQRAALLARRLDLGAAVLDWAGQPSPETPTNVDSHSTRLSLMTPDQVGTVVHTHDDFKRLLDFVHALRTGFVEETGFLEALSASLAPTKGDGTPVSFADLSALAAASHGEEIHYLEIAGIGGAREMTYGELRDFVAVSDLQRAVLLPEQCQTDVHTLASWLQTSEDPAIGEVSADAAQDIKRHLQRRYDDPAWARVAGPLRDSLRETQRDALLAYVECYFDYDRDNFDLFGWLLIDPLMSACAPTSRIKAAAGSIQQLVTRMHLNHEPFGATPPSVLAPELRAQWPWRKNYRVWEAQRKVYLYPENWLDPQLRDDKTELFERFEATIRGAEINSANVEEALRGYLRGLNDIARLEISGLHHEVERDHNGKHIVRDVLHVFGRERGRSGRHYYRARLAGDAGSGWTAWEELPFEVDASDVLPVVFNRRLMLFWLRHEDLGDNAEGSEGDNQEPPRHLQTTLVWAERQFGQWSSPKHSEDTILAMAIDHEDIREFIKSNPTRSAVRLIEAFMPLFRDGGIIERPASPESLRMLHDMSSDNRLRIHVRFSLSTTEYESGYPGYFELGGCDGSAQAVLALDTHRHIGAEKLRPKETLNLGQGFFARHGSVRLSDNEDEIFYRRETERRFETINPRPYVPTSESPPPWWQTFYQDEKYTLHIDGGRRTQTGNQVPIGSLSRALSATPLSYLERDLQLNAPPVGQLPSATGIGARDLDRQDFAVEAFYHPFTCDMIRQLEEFGVDGLYRPEADSSLVRQESETLLLAECADDGEPPFFRSFCPGLVAPTAPGRLDKVFGTFEFAAGSPFGVYNWELFYHIPVFISGELAAQRSYAEALKWLRYIFDPSAVELGKDKVDYWRFGPFRDQTLSLEKLLEMLASGDSSDPVVELAEAIKFAQHNPFNSHGVARFRTVPYQIAVVLRYVQVLVDWGDDLFRQATNESVTEATQLYVLAESLLGRRPVQLPAKHVLDRNYCQLCSNRRDGQCVGLVDIENYLSSGAMEVWTPFPVYMEGSYGETYRPAQPVQCDPNARNYSTTDLALGGPTFDRAVGIDKVGLQRMAQPQPMNFHVSGQGDDQTLYFCVPHNDRLELYWDTVEDRLQKIRNCLGLDGAPLNLSLFAPPIDPGALVAAVSKAGDIGAAIDQMNAPPPIYRFMTHLEMAKSLSKRLERLGSELLSALTKKDAQFLEELRAGQSVQVLAQVDRVLRARVEEAGAALDAAQEMSAAVATRVDFYKNRTARSSHETTQQSLTNVAATLQGVSTGLTKAAAIANLVPTFRVAAEGVPGTPLVTSRFGGSNFLTAFSSTASALSGVAGTLSTVAQNNGLSAQFERRDEDWAHALAQAELDAQRVGHELSVARSRFENAERDLARHRLEREQAEEVESYLKSRFTSSEMFSWMSRELSTIFYRAYQVAFDTAKRAMAAFELELAEPPADTLNFSTWQAGRKGLLSGENFTHQLRKLESDYLDRNNRELELHKTIALSQLDRPALERLRATGSCEFHVPETLFDLDHPGHFLRRIKSLEVSIPCAMPGKSSVPATITLVRSQVRAVLPEAGPTDDEAEFRLDGSGGVRRIALSSGVVDSGQFNLTLGDSRYLPFENLGAVSTWQVRFPAKHRVFDYNTISDVVFDLRYTARDGGQLYRTAVVDSLETRIQTAPSVFGLSVRGAYADQWPIWRQLPDSPLLLKHMLGMAGLVDSGTTTVFLGLRQTPGSAKLQDPTLVIEGSGFTLSEHTESSGGTLWLANSGHLLTTTDEDPPLQLHLNFGGAKATDDQIAAIQDILIFFHHVPDFNA